MKMSVGEGKTFSWIERKYDGGEFVYLCDEKCEQCQGCQRFFGDNRDSRSNINDFGKMNSILMWWGKNITA